MVRRERATRGLLIRSTVPNVFCAGADLKVCSCCHEARQPAFAPAVVNAIPEKAHMGPL